MMAHSQRVQSTDITRTGHEIIFKLRNVACPLYFKLLGLCTYVPIFRISDKMLNFEVKISEFQTRLGSFLRMVDN